MNQNHSAQPSGPDSSQNPKGLIAAFATHRVAPNLLMCLMLIAGFWGIKKLNTQLFPNFDLDWVVVSVIWSGTSAEDIEQAITVPLEYQLKSVEGVEQMVSSSRADITNIYIQINENFDSMAVLDSIKQRVATVRNLPQDAEQPVVRRLERFSEIAHILISGGDSLSELRPYVRSMENQLLARGIGRVDFDGLAEEELAIQIPNEQLHDLGLTLSQTASIVRQHSQDLPAGTAGRRAGAKQLRSLGQARDADSLAELPLITNTQGRLVRLGDIAIIERRARDGEGFISYQGRPAVEMTVLRAETDDALISADIMKQWVADVQETLPPNIEVHLFFETWKYLKDRIQTLLKNGLSGLVLVIAVLFLFLNARVAFWVAAGIPISFMATLGVLYLAGGSLNMISLFALILALGIIVDDAIVVGEDTLTHRQMGEPALQAALGGARRMFYPVLASSLTTIFAFLPLMMVSGVIGKMTFEIPLVVICVILASLVECFLILPGHLHHSLSKEQKAPSRFRVAMDDKFKHFQQITFRPWAERATQKPGTTLTLAVCLFAISITLLVTGHLPYNQFPNIDQERIRASAKFTAGTKAETVDNFLQHLEDTLYDTNEEFGGNLVLTSMQHHRSFFTFPSLISAFKEDGDEYGVLSLEVNTDAKRTVTNDQFIEIWRSKIRQPAGLERLTIGQPDTGPPGKPIEIQLYGADLVTLKAASEQLQRKLESYFGVTNVDDDAPLGREQLIYSLTPTAKALGLTLQSVGRQMRSALDGELVQIFNEGNDELEIRVLLPDDERASLKTLEDLPIVTPAGNTVPLANTITLTAQPGVSVIRHLDNELSVTVRVDLNQEVANPNEIISDLEQSFLPELRYQFGIETDYKGKLESQQKSFADLKIGTLIGLVMIYLILAWVFASYSWPLAVMSAIVLGLTGAIFGHYLLLPFGIDFSFMSVMGLFGLSGIIVNDSIVLITFYRNQRQQGVAAQTAIVEACCARLRAVLLTSITTIAGLTPILFEGSLQAQFLKPMAVSIVFGLAYGTTLILFVVPALLMLIERANQRWSEQYLNMKKAWVGDEINDKPC